MPVRIAKSKKKKLYVPATRFLPNVEAFDKFTALEEFQRFGRRIGTNNCISPVDIIDKTGVRQ